MVYSTDRSKAVVPVLVLLFVDLWFILRGDLLYVLPYVILFLCFSVLLVLRLPRLGKRELILVLFVRLFDLCLFGFVGFLFLLVSGKGCGLWLWHSLDVSLTFLYIHVWTKKDCNRRTILEYELNYTQFSATEAFQRLSVNESLTDLISLQTCNLHVMFCVVTCYKHVNVNTPNTKWVELERLTFLIKESYVINACHKVITYEPVYTISSKLRVSPAKTQSLYICVGWSENTLGAHASCKKCCAQAQFSCFS